MTARSDIGSLTLPNFVLAQGNITLGTVRALKGDKTFCRRVVIYGKKDYRVNNTGNVWVGPQIDAGSQPVLVAPGGEVEIVAPPGCKLDLNKWYIDAEGANDGFVMIYDKD